MQVNLQADVCVVGGGLAGLAALHQISQSGSGITGILVEARDRPGGRTCTLLADSNIKPGLFSSACVDVGGQWIGPDHTRLLALIKTHKLDLDEQFYPVTGGNTLSNLISLVSYEFPKMTPNEELEVAKFMDTVDRLGNTMDLKCPWAMQDASFLDISIYDYIVTHVFSQNAVDEIIVFIQTITACDVKQCSFLFFVFYIASGNGIRALGDGKHGAQKYKLKQGAQSVSNALLDAICTPNVKSIRTLFSSTVRRVEVVDGEYMLKVTATKYSMNQSSPLVPVTIICKRLVLAMSPRLSIQSIEYNPSLPQEKLALAASMVPGCCIKVIIVFESAFWLHKVAAGTRHVCDLSPIHNLFHSTVGGYPALVGLITANQAKVHSMKTSEERYSAVLEQLYTLYCSPSTTSDSSSPHIAASHPDPIAYYEKNWSEEDKSDGCFACSFTPGTFITTGLYLRSPVGYSNSAFCLRSNKNFPESENSLIFWASTETAEDYYGYMEGAIRAGEATADTIIQSLRV
mmetsp:Transcript_4952/g.7559  ORF Transcript_4952/g.7559 Transcript_4952/m.7559 type:complete len:516 (-) Transcript_4952:181-1728(-)